jgi:hypothetical protein
MSRYKVTLTNVTLVMEVDAPNENAARGAVYNAFRESRPYDALQGTKFGFDATEKECSAGELMTTTVPGMRDVEAELA